MPSDEVKLFTHGQLQTFCSPPDSRVPGSVHPARVRGRLFQIQGGSDTALVDVGNPKAPYIHGQVMTISKKSLPALDALEHHADDQRTSATTEAGDPVQLYHYNPKNPLPEDADPISAWHGKGKGVARPLDLHDLPFLARPAPKGKP
jgi:hypothetical protein